VAIDQRHARGLCVTIEKEKAGTKKQYDFFVLKSLSRMTGMI